MRARESSAEREPKTGEFRCIVCGTPGHNPSQCYVGTIDGSFSLQAVPTIRYLETRVKVSRLYGALSRLDSTSYAAFIMQCNTLTQEPLPAFLANINTSRPQGMLITMSGQTFSKVPQNTYFGEHGTSTLMHPNTLPYSDKPQSNPMKQSVRFAGNNNNGRYTGPSRDNTNAGGGGRHSTFDNGS